MRLPKSKDNYMEEIEGIINHSKENLNVVSVVMMMGLLVEAVVDLTDTIEIDYLSPGDKN